MYISNILAHGLFCLRNKLSKMWFYEIFEGGKRYIYIYMKLIMERKIYEIDDGKYIYICEPIMEIFMDMDMEIYLEMVMDMHIMKLRMLKCYLMSLPCDTQIWG